MPEARPESTVTLATFNVHMGVDGWGRPFDLVAECAALDADILVLQEAWTPEAETDPTDGGTAARVGVTGTAETLVDRLGYAVVAAQPLARGRLYEPVETASRRWSPLLGQVPRLHRAHRLDDERRRTRASRFDRPFVRGRWGIALLARIPMRDAGVLDLGRLRRDPARRAVVHGTTDLGGRPLIVYGTHMSHITHFSPAQYRRLARLLPPPDTAAVLAGDMNLWGPPVNSFFPTWRRAVVGRTWPSWRPHSQLDHVLVTEALSVVAARVGPFSGSDHRPVVVTLALA